MVSLPAGLRAEAVRVKSDAAWECPAPCASFDPSTLGNGLYSVAILSPRKKLKKNVLQLP